MVRNWQARVEQADVRRKQAKQKKQLSEDRKLWKQWISDCIRHQLDDNLHQLQLLSLLATDTTINHTASAVDKNLDSHDSNKAKLYIHIWTDTKPNLQTDEAAQTKDCDDFDDEQNTSKKKHRPKSYSVGNDEDIDNEVKLSKRGSKKEQRSRSSSTGESGGGNYVTVPKKKAHPRSKEAMSMEHVSSGFSSAKDDDEVSMCRSYFFTGACSLMKKKNACRHVHPTSSSNTSDSQFSTNRTLYSLLSSNRLADHEQQLQKSARAEMAAAERAETINTTIAAVAAASMHISSPMSNTTTLGSSTTAADPIVVIGAMNMAYHIEVPILFDTNSEHSDDDSDTTLIPSEQISKVLSQQNASLGNIVYMAMNGVLIFDRHQNGVLYRDEDFLHAIFGEQAVDNVVLCKRDRCSNNPEDAALLVNMPSAILQSICSYLLDESIVSMTQVCRVWNDDISHGNEEVWRGMLNRREWPYDDCTDQDQETRNYSYREQFHQHYSVMRDMRALHNVVESSIPKCSLRNLSNTDVAVYDYVSRQNAPKGSCVGMEEWSPRHIVQAFEIDCTVRLYESSLKATTGEVLSHEKICRELIIYCFNPYRNTKKKFCDITQLVLDKRDVTTLCTVTVFPYYADTEILVSISRDDFLLGESEGGGVDNEKSDGNKATQPLQVFNLTDEILKYMLGDHTDSPPVFQTLMEGDRSQRFSSVSCSASSCGPGLVLISTQLYLKQADVEHTEYLDTRLFLVSTTMRQILWSYSCDPELDEDYRLGREFNSCATFLRSGHGIIKSRALWDFGVTSGGRNEHIITGEIDSSGTVSAVNILATTVWMPKIENDEQWSKYSKARQKIMVTSNEIITADAWVKLDEDGSWLSTSTIVSFYPKNGTASEASILEFSDNLIFQQFSCVRDQYLIVLCDEFNCRPDPRIVREQTGQEVVIVVHIPSRQEVGRLSWYDYNDEELPRLVRCGQETFGLAIHRGVLMTGNDVRYCCNANMKANILGNPDVDGMDSELLASTRKKKKKAVRTKKDSFRSHNGNGCF